MSLLSTIRVLCRMVTIEHSVFALPFAFMGAFIAAPCFPGWPELLLLTTAMVCVRSFAMTVNRIADLRYDALNPRTASRPLVTGEITVRQAWIFGAAMAFGFIASTAGMNSLCLSLSPVALAVAGFYSYTKRFTWLCHFVLGTVLAMAPLAGYWAVEPEPALGPLLLSLAVLFWAAGFDIFYACQDVDFDRQHNLHSVPARFGLPTALALAGFCHVNMVIFLVLAGLALEFPWTWQAVVAVVAIVLRWEHTLVSPDDLSRLNLAFFTANGLVALLLFGGVLLSIYL